MSYSIEYSGEVYVVPAKEGSLFGDPDYMVVITQGDNNVYDAGSNKRSRDTSIVSYGWNYIIIGDVCNRAGACEGGGLQLVNGSTTPESYLKRYRDKIKKAIPIKEFYAQEKTAILKLNTTLDEWEQKTIVETKLEEFIYEEPDHYHPEVMIKKAKIVINSLERLKQFLALKRMSQYNVLE